MTRIATWFDAVILDLGRQMRWSFLPPLMVYFAYGASGLTSIVGTFFVKEYLDVSAAFVAGLAFWAGLPWALKMPMGHLVDLLWRLKWLLVFVGAALVSGSLLIMYGLSVRLSWMADIMSPTAWYVLATVLAPTGFVVQDAVADAMSVEAVPRVDADGVPLDAATQRAMHTTMQTLGRIALIGALSAVAVLNISLFAGIEEVSPEAKAATYGRVYLIGLFIPLISISGVLLAMIQQQVQIKRLVANGLDKADAQAHFAPKDGPVSPNWWYFIGGGLFIAITLTVGLTNVPFSQEIVFAGSMGIVLFLINQLTATLSPEKTRTLIGTAIIIFVFRAVPLPGAASTWFTIDQLGFDQQFLSVLSLVTSMLTLLGMLVLRPMMASRTIVDIVVFLSIATGVLALPNIALYYGIHEWTASMTGGVVDARFIALIDAAVESPLGQIAMIPMLAWIAGNAPGHLKATFFAVMASFTNLALSTSNLGTKYLNQIFLVTREVTEPDGTIITPADYSQLGYLLVTVALISVILPLITVLVVQNTAFKSRD